MLANVRQATIRPIIEATVAEGTVVNTDEYNVYARLEAWGYGHKTVCHARGEYARDDDGRRLLRGSRQHAGRLLVAATVLAPPAPRHLAGEAAPGYLCFFQLVHNARRRGKALLGTLVAGLVA